MVVLRVRDHEIPCTVTHKYAKVGYRVEKPMSWNDSQGRPPGPLRRNFLTFFIPYLSKFDFLSPPWWPDPRTPMLILCM